MLEEVIMRVLDSSGATATIFLIAVVALWRTLQTAIIDRIVALEKAIKACNEKHEACEKRNRKLSSAVIDIINGNSSQAMIRCKAIIEGEDNDA